MNRYARGGGGEEWSPPLKLPPLKVKTCENLNSQLSQYKEYINILKGDEAQIWQGMMKTVKKLKDSLPNARRRKRPIIRGKIEVATAEAEAFYNKSKLSNLDLNLFLMEEDVGYGIAKYKAEIRYIKEHKDWIDQKCKDPVEGGRKSRRKRRRRTNKRKSRRKSRRRKSTKKKRRRRRR